MDKDNELKPCPFCGSNVSTIMGDKHIWFYIMCTKCFCDFGKYYDIANEMYEGEFETEQEAIDAWNTRKGE